MFPDVLRVLRLIHKIGFGFSGTGGEVRFIVLEHWEAFLSHLTNMTKYRADAPSAMKEKNESNRLRHSLFGSQVASVGGGTCLLCESERGE